MKRGFRPRKNWRNSGSNKKIINSHFTEPKKGSHLFFINHLQKIGVTPFFFLLPLLEPVFPALFIHKMNGTGGSEFAVKLRVPASEAVLAQIDAVFHALAACFPVFMVYACTHGESFMSITGSVRKLFRGRGVFLVAPLKLLDDKRLRRGGAGLKILYGLFEFGSVYHAGQFFNHY